uniref:Response regulator n=1 Tax=Gracilinema caldarium TaxID=215591 RepID=A0A7C3E7N6_9SPIR
MNERIFLVDDEQPVLDGLSVIISKYLPELSLCGTARSGKDAIEGILQTRPDIVIMDVRMPGMSGIDVLKELDRLGFDCISILLTAYERFDIAREAFALGVYNYLVKPVEQDRFIKILQEAQFQVRRRKERSQQAVNAIEQLQSVRPLIEEGFLHYLLLGDSSKITLQAYAKVFGWDTSSQIWGHCAVVTSKHPLNYEELNSIKTEISNYLDCILGSLFGLYILLCIPGENTERTIDTLQKLLVTFHELELHYSIGKAEQDCFITRSLIDAFQKLPELHVKSNNQGLSVHELAKKTIEQISLRTDTETALLIGLNQLLSQQLSIPGNYDRRAWLALKYIEENYEKAISLDDAAHAVELSPAYLSRLLVSETGKSFIEHLTKYRLDRACKELALGNLSIKEIAAMCGYPDSNYFSRIFKKNIGQTPSEYAANYRRTVV